MKSRQQTKEMYDREADAYDESRAIFEKGRFADRERKLLAEFLEGESLVLFLACGTGRHFRSLVNDVGCEVVGLDISVNMLKIAKRKQTVHLVVADAENLPFKQSAFDAVVCSRAFYLFRDKFKILQEAYVALKTGKKLMISTVFRDLLLTRLGIKLNLFSPTPAQFPTTSKQVAELFRKAQYNNIQRRCIVSFTGSAHMPKAALPIVNLLEDKLQGGRWAMVIGEK